MRGVILAWPRVCLGRIGFLAKRSLRSFKSRQSWGWALVVVVMSAMIAAGRSMVARLEGNNTAGLGGDCAAASVPEAF